MTHATSEFSTEKGLHNLSSLRNDWLLRENKEEEFALVNLWRKGPFIEGQESKQSNQQAPFACQTKHAGCSFVFSTENCVTNACESIAATGHIYTEQISIDLYRVFLCFTSLYKAIAAVSDALPQRERTWIHQLPRGGKIIMQVSVS